MPSREMIVAVAGGSGFIGGAIVRHLLGAGYLVRIITRDPAQARKHFVGTHVDFFRSDLTDPRSLRVPLAGVGAIVHAAQFDGYPVENPRRGLTFDRIDYGGVRALIDMADQRTISHFVYISGAGADAGSMHPAFRAKGHAENAVRNSGFPFTILRPGLTYGPGDRVISMFARILRFSPVFVIPGNGRQRVQPLLVDDLAQCAMMALEGHGRNGMFAIGGPETMTFDELLKLLMEVTGRQRLLVHAPGGLLKAAGAAAEMMPARFFSRDAADFLMADKPCDNRPLLEAFKLTLTPPRIGMRYLTVNNFLKGSA